jgi:hypothetical protein
MSSPARTEAVTVVEGRAVDAPEGRQFDFWLGCWELRWEPDGQGVNDIVSILDDHVILERFDGRPSIPMAGMSVSIYDGTIRAWRQTWVDSEGQYLDFTGGIEGDRMVLRRRRDDGRLQRMVWSDIKPESLRWSWEHSNDEGRNWTVAWAIDYRRRPLDPATQP